MLERPPPKLDTLHFTVDQFDLWQRLAETAYAIGAPPPDLNLHAAFREVLRSFDFYSVCVETALGSYDAS